MDMSIKKKHFDLIKNGLKTVELRLFDGKRRGIKPGDKIIFSCDGDGIAAEVLELITAETFQELCKKINIQDAGFSSEKELLSAIRKFYTPEQQQEYGVVGIRISLSGRQAG